MLKVEIENATYNGQVQHHIMMIVNLVKQHDTLQSLYAAIKRDADEYFSLSYYKGGSHVAIMARNVPAKRILLITER
jgi:hypothetical protein